MFKYIRNRFQLFARDQKGQVLIMALIFITLFALMLGPLLSFTGSAIKQGSALEKRTVRIYAAGAGIESARQNISNGATALPSSIGSSWGPYTLDNLAFDLTVNVTITLTSQTSDTKTYTIHSSAVTRDGKNNSIDATITARQGDYRYYLNNSFTAGGTLGLKNKVGVNGFVQCENEDFAGKGPTWGDNPDPPPDQYCDRLIDPVIWPTSSELKSYYNNLLHDTHSSGWSISSNSTLTCTEYVIGSCNINSDSINLNCQTIFVDGNISVGAGVIGPGVLVATGNIAFSPKSDTGDANGGVLIFSLGDINFWPSGTFYGWVAAKGNINAKSGSGPNYNWLTPNNNLNFPRIKGEGGSNSGAGQVIISSWKEN